MKKILYPPKQSWNELLQRPLIAYEKLRPQVQEILDTVKADKDMALKRYTQDFDRVALDSLEVSEEEKKEAATLVADELKHAIEVARRNIWKFHSAQLHEPKEVETSPGVYCWQKSVPIQKVGLYVPGGTAPLFSTVLMLGIPAQIAECEEIILCTPPNEEGKVHPSILYAAQVAGVHRIFKVGGAQAIAAMAYGTETIPQVYKIFGPGNQYVMAAKQLVSLNDVAIDMPAGPSEVEVLADETAHPAFVASDLLSQAEHGADSQSILVTTSENLIDQVIEEVHRQLDTLQRKEIAQQALQHCKLILLKDIDEAIEMTNQYAPEHLIVSHRGYMVVAERIVNAGSVFLGNMSPESVGDYASGTNHTLPTNGFAKAYSGVNMDSFMKKITFQQLTKDGLSNIGNAVILMAQNEGLTAHANAVAVRLGQHE